MADRPSPREQQGAKCALCGVRVGIHGLRDEWGESPDTAALIEDPERFHEWIETARPDLDTYRRNNP